MKANGFPASPWWLTLAFRLRGTARVRWALLSAALLSVLAGCALHAQLATLLSPAQENRRVLGAADMAVSVSLGSCDVSRDCAAVQTLPEAARRVGATAADMSLMATGLSGSTDRGSESLLEAPWSDQVFPERMRLNSGRWPSSPDEVALPLGRPLPEKAVLTAYGSVVRWRVVGVYEDRFDRDASQLLAGPGATGRIFELLRADGDRYTRPTSIAKVRASGVPAQRVVDALVAPVATMTHTDAAVVRDDVRASLTLRQLESASYRAGLDRLPSRTGWSLLIAVSLIGALLTAFVARATELERLRTLRDWGVPDTPVLAAANAGTFLAILVVQAGAAVAGEALGRTLRPLVGTLVAHPLSPPMVPWPVLWVGAGAAAAAVAGRAAADGAALWSRRAPAALSTVGRRLRGALHAGRHVATVVAVLVLGMWSVSVLSDPELNSSGAVARWVAAATVVGCLALGLLVSAVRDLRGMGPLPVLLAVRRLRRERLTTAVAAAIIAAAVSLPLGVGIAMATDEYYAKLALISPFAPGQVTLGWSGGSSASASAIRKEFEDYTGLHDPVRVRTAVVMTSLGGKDLGQGLPFALDTPDDVERLIGHPLTQQQREVFADGGLLIPDTSANHVPLGASISTRVPSGGPGADVSTTMVQDVPEAYSHGSLGFISSATVLRRAWETEYPCWVYTNVTGVALQAALRAPEEKGFDTNMVGVYEVPKPVALPPSYRMGAAALGGCVVLVVLAFTRRMLTGLRPYRSSLSALGVPARFLDLAAAVMLAITVLIPLVAGHALALGLNIFAWGRLTSASRGAQVPWPDVWLSLGATCGLSVTILLGALLVGAVRRSRPGKQSAMA